MATVNTKFGSAIKDSRGALSVLYVTLGSRNISVFSPASMTRLSPDATLRTGVFVHVQVRAIPGMVEEKEAVWANKPEVNNKNKGSNTFFIRWHFDANPKLQHRICFPHRRSSPIFQIRF